MLELKDIKGVIFDFDGTLVSSLQMHLDSWRGAALDIFQKDLPEAVLKSLIGRSTRANAQIVSEFFSQGNRWQELMKAKEQLLRERTFEVAVFPGVHDVFAYLRKEDIPFGIASNAPTLYVQRVCEHVGLQADVILGFDQVARPKPEPDLFLKCAQDLGLRACIHPEVVVFEDSTHGVHAACAAGMYAIGVLTQESKASMLDAGAKTCVETVAAFFSEKL